MKKFRFKEFDIQQSKSVFRVGTDAVVLGALANVENATNVLEVGVGTGIVSLMLAQRNRESCFTGIDINPEAVELAEHNFQSSPFGDRMEVFCCDFNTLVSSRKYDVIVSNPPYFDENSSTKDVVARQKVKLSFHQLIKKSAELLSEKGRLILIFPSIFDAEISDLAQQERLFLHQRINVFGIEGGEVKRLILTFTKQVNPFLEKDFVIEKSPRNYSDEYLECTKAFHVFSNS